jgi:hypothetical protein
VNYQCANVAEGNTQGLAVMQQHDEASHAPDTYPANEGQAQQQHAYTQAHTQPLVVGDKDAHRRYNGLQAEDDDLHGMHKVTPITE